MDSEWAKWEAANGIKELVDPTRDALYNFDEANQKAFKSSKVWKTDPNYFKNVRISSSALLKMVTHARSGGTIEVMGLMLGALHGDTFVVTDAVRLPVEGTETRVNAQDEANEFIVNYLELLRDSGRPENPLGWYHSHPGYGCWLSGIDVATQANWQNFDDPFLAVVIDPERTMSQGKVEIGAFRTYPENYKPEAVDSDQMIPQEKAKDFGMHYNRYYSLDVSYFKSTLDTEVLSRLWNKYWVSTLSQNPLLSNRDYTTKQIKDIAAKITEAVTQQREPKSMSAGVPGPISKDPSDKDMVKITRASRRLDVHQQAGAIAADVKDEIFTAPIPEK
ncbi:COP9 signalosome complex subunit 5 [Microthyrium microscopicum]|uniref:COP9 signalosome complex subunit 5 n=1 Tax=Microthyrium microscopicum TaxID=703497 RepID=A0A6A6UH85_9PEZI|nr:COP9 signalosome complex subunit 5 [Microthyrium microscopicum]